MRVEAIPKDIEISFVKSKLVSNKASHDVVTFHPYLLAYCVIFIVTSGTFNKVISDCSVHILWGVGCN